MRAYVAKRSHTHALDDEITKLSLSQLSLVYRQLLLDEKKEKEEHYSMVGELNKFWSKNLGTLFENLQMFVNLDMYKRLQEQKELEQHRDEISPDNFVEEWEKMMEVVPNSIEVSDVDQGDPMDQLPQMSAEDEEIVSGWVSDHKESE